MARAGSSKPSRYFETALGYVPADKGHRELLKRVYSNYRSSREGSNRVGSGTVEEDYRDGSLFYLPSWNKRMRITSKATSRSRYLGDIHSPEYSQHVADKVAKRKAARTKEMQKNIDRKKAKTEAYNRNNAIMKKLKALNNKD